MLADPTTRVTMLSSLGGAYLMLWRARGETTFRNSGSIGGDYQGTNTSRDVVEIRLDVSSDRMDLLHRAQHFLQEALMAPEKLNDPAIRAQVGETNIFYSVAHVCWPKMLQPPSPNSLVQKSSRPTTNHLLASHVVKQVSAKKHGVTARRHSRCTQASSQTLRFHQGPPP